MYNTKEEWHIRTTSILTAYKNPKYFKNQLDNKVDEATPKFLEVGTQTHMYILEYEKFKDTYITLDYTKPKGELQQGFCSFIADNLIKDSNVNIDELCIEAYINNYKVKKSENKIKEESKKLYDTYKEYIRFLMKGSNKEIISFGTLNTLKETKDIIQNHKLACSLMFEDPFSTEKHYNETLIVWEFPKVFSNGDPILVKSTIDKFVIDHTNKIIKLIDFKTTSDLTEFDKSFKEHDNYKVQLACYWFAVEKYFRTTFTDKNINEYNRETYLVAVQTKNPYKDYPVNCEVYLISEQTLKDGLFIIEKALPEITWHFEQDLWDHTRSYYEGIGIKQIL